MSDSPKRPSNTPSSTARRPTRPHVGDDELSLDTRLAAQAILNDESIGRTTQSMTPRGPSPVIEWLSQRQIMLTIISIICCASAAVIPIFIKTSQRASTEGIRQILEGQASKLGQTIGVERMAKLIEGKDVRTLQEFYTQQRASVVQAFSAKGHPIDAQDLRIRVDDENQTLVLGVQFTNAELGHRLYWANFTGGYDGRGAPSAEIASVFKDDKGSLVVCLVVELIILSVVWGLPFLSRRRNQAE
ncbi:MAG: hypothetical protein VX589_04785 [Myxococcota bacterium]|nr:hypothetical protein [Myxococcota bacterium]